MECKDFEKAIPDFLNNKLNYFELKEFKKHLEHCDNCNEELVIQFLVSEGLQRLEEGDAFDLQAELDARLKEAEKKLVRQSKALHIGNFFELILMIVLFVIVFWILL